MTALDGARRDAVPVVAAIVALAGLAWVYLVEMAGAMDAGMAAMTGISPAMAYDLPALFAMWAVMMVGMMLPGATPMIVLFATVNRQKRRAGAPSVPTAVFALGYLLAWTAFSLLAAVLQAWLHAHALLSPAMAGTSPAFGGALFVMAGLYQWTPLKNACLRTCRSPLSFLLNRWREGAGGALAMGLEHGAFCVGCCWFLMGLLFAVGVMNLVWVAAIALFVLAEKVLPGGRAVAGAGGALMVAAGLYLVARGLGA